MKKILVLILVVGCNSNGTMTDLLNKQKDLKDQISLAKNKEAMFLDSAKSTRDLSFADSSTAYFGQAHQLQERLDAVNFSIDSLSKMK
jgi:hypothetical protein